MVVLESIAISLYCNSNAQRLTFFLLRIRTGCFFCRNVKPKPTTVTHTYLDFHKRAEHSLAVTFTVVYGVPSTVRACVRYSIVLCILRCAFYGACVRYSIVLCILRCAFYGACICVRLRAHRNKPFLSLLYLVSKHTKRVSQIPNGTRTTIL